MHAARFSPLAIAQAAVLLVACGSSDSAEDCAGTACRAPTGNQSAAVTYYEDVAPIIDRACSQCHSEGEVAPFELKTYEQVQPLGSVIEHVTAERIMPPWLADNSGDCQNHQDSNWLSQRDIQLIRDWVQGGMLEGNPERMPPFVKKTNHLEDATHTLRMTAEYTPNAPVDGDDYRCFILDPGIDTDKFLTAYEVTPGNAHLVHHVIVYNPDNADEVAAAEALDADEDGDGYTCFGGPVVGASVAAAWAPGRNTWSYPAGTGIRLKPGIKQIVQVHYHVHPAVAPDRSEVKLRLVDSVDKELFAWFFANTALVLPPGEPNARATLEMTPDLYLRAGLERPEMSRPMSLVGIAPHMHKLGRTERVELTRADGSNTECLVQVPRWDFNWQFMYLYEEPLPLQPDDLLKMTCEYDTSERSEPVRWGEGTLDEMCLALMFTTFDE
jgi:hypothetical protein